MGFDRSKVLNRRNAAKVLMVIYDAITVNVAYFLALILRFYVKLEFNSGVERFISMFWQFAPFYAIASVLIFYAFKLYHIMWQYGDLHDLGSVFVACLATVPVQLVGTMVFFERMPLSYYILGPIIQFVLVAMGRFVYKFYLMERNQRNVKKNATVSVMIVGVNAVGQFARKQIEENSSMKAVCVVDSQDHEPNRYMNGLPVIGGTETLEDALEKKKIGYVVIADQRLSAEQSKAIKELCERKGIEVEELIEYLQNNNDSYTPVALNANAEGPRVIPFSPPDISNKEIVEVKKALTSGWITTGPRTKELEKRLAAYCHTSRVVCLNSATAAEELNFRVCGIGEGDEVIVPAYTYTASASAAIHCGARVIFVDSQKDNCEMDYDKVAAAITERTKAVVAVDLGGIIADYDKLFAVVESKRALFQPKQGNDLGARIQQAVGRALVFADCAHALGASRHGKMAGEIADFTDFSFHAVKNFTTAEGGASTWRDIPGIDNEEMYHQYQLFSLHGQSKDALAKTKIGAWEYDIVGPWYKCNMTDIMAAIGLKQLERYPGMLARRREIIGRYDAMCDELGVKHLVHYTKDSSSSGHLYVTRIPGITDAQRREIITKLAERGVSTNVHYKPLPMMTAYKALGWDIKDFPNAYAYYENLITLPLHTKLSDEDVAYVIAVFKDVVKDYAV